jgi:hypothetical protein
MEATTPDPDLLPQEPVRDAAVTRRVGQLRLLAGLLQGGLLYFLYRAQQSGAWPASHAALYLPLVLAGIVLPVLLISSLGHLERRPMALWLGAAAAVLAVVGMHDAWRNALEHAPIVHPSILLFPFCAGFFFVAHSLVMAGGRDRRWLAHYATCFESAWKLAIQLLFSALFVLGVWLVMWMGAALFGLLKLNFLEKLLLKSWFSVPLVCLAFSSAMHTTDVRPAIVRGIRSLLLVLKAWILPIAVLLVGGFLVSLPFTGLEVLWQTRHATAVLLASCAVLAVLVNAAFQAGDAAAGLARIVRVAARVACFLLAPLAVLGVYALGLRVADHGWTPDRVIAAACLMVALFYAGGYVLAAARRSGPWLDALRQVNIAAALLALAVALAMFSPVADPARISVADQVSRLARGATPAEKFDYGFLRYRSARYGTEALQALAAHGAGPQADAVRTRAASALNERYEDRTARRAAESPTAPANLRVWPKGAQLPAGFLKQDWVASWWPYAPPGCVRGVGGRCDAIVLDGDGDGRPDVLLLAEERGGGAALLSERNGKWQVVGRPAKGLAGCLPLQERLRAGQFTLATTPLRDIEVGGQRIVLVPQEPEPPDCGSQDGAQAASAPR